MILNEIIVIFIVTIINGLNKTKMKKLLIILLATVFIGCSTDDDGCKCNGKFTIFDQGGTFTVDGVDCDTGEPYLSNGAEGTIYLGCDD